MLDEGERQTPRCWESANPEKMNMSLGIGARGSEQHPLRFADYFVICGLDKDSGLEPDKYFGEFSFTRELCALRYRYLAVSLFLLLAWNNVIVERKRETEKK